MSSLTLESATKLCLPWDSAIHVDADTSPHEAYQASNGVVYGPNNLEQVGQTTAAAANGAPTAVPGSMGDRVKTLAAKENIPLPELTELTVSGMSGLDLIALVMMRKEMRVPLKALRIDRRDQEVDDISDEIWASLKKTVGKVEWVKVDTEDSDDEGDSEEDDDVMSIDGFELDAEDEDEDENENENEEDFFEAEDQHMAHEEC